MISKKDFRKRMKGLTIPKGFTSEMREEKDWGNVSTTHLIFVVKSDDIELRFDQSGSGHTDFKIGDSTLTFDRLGVEDSFYHLPFGDWDKVKYDLNAILKEQLSRVAKQRERAETAMAVPDIPFTLAPEELKKYKSRLAKGNQITFMPSGFGTGYQISKVPRRDAKRASSKMEAFFGIDPLFISSFDAD